MSATTAIEWTERSWNPIGGCSLATPGCTNCYAMAMAARLDRMGVPHYAELTKGAKAGPVWTGKLGMAPERVLLEPLRRRKPTTWFVNSMGDLFHEDVPDAWIDRVFAVMALSPQHTFQVLTKRAARMREYCWNPQSRRRIYDLVCDLTLDRALQVILIADRSREPLAPAGRRVLLGQWPLPNVWLGVSAEDQKRADERVPDLLATPAAIRFVSAEPLLGPIDFTYLQADSILTLDALSGLHADCDGGVEGVIDSPDPKLDWIIVGGESGPKARPMHPDWARSIRNQCAAAGTAFFFKQWGEWCPISHMDEAQSDRCYHPAPAARPEATRRERKQNCILHADGRRFDGRDRFSYGAFQAGTGAMTMFAIGKASAGRLLDGIEHNAMPSCSSLSRASTSSADEARHG